MYLMLLPKKLLIFFRAPSFVMHLIGLGMLLGFSNYIFANALTEESNHRIVLQATLISPTDVVADQPVFLTFKLVNVSSSTINLPWPRFIDQFITSEIKSPEGAAWRIKHPGGSLGHGRYPGGDIKPGAVFNINLLHTFPRHGHYEVKCILDTSSLSGHNIWNIWEGRVESNTITVKVRKKSG